MAKKWKLQFGLVKGFEGTNKMFKKISGYVHDYDKDQAFTLVYHGLGSYTFKLDQNSGISDLQYFIRDPNALYISTSDSAGKQESWIMGKLEIVQDSMKNKSLKGNVQFAASMYKVSEVNSQTTSSDAAQKG